MHTCGEGINCRGAWPGSSVICLAASVNVQANLKASTAPTSAPVIPTPPPPPPPPKEEQVPSASPAEESYSTETPITNSNRHARGCITSPPSTTNMSLHLSQCRQNYHQDSEAGINRQINMELYASYCYQSMGFYFERDDIALPGFAKFFKNLSGEEREHAEKLMSYQIKRGGRIVLQDVKKPERDEWGTGLDAMQVALQLEKSVNQALLDLHKVCSSHEDPQMCDFVEHEFLEEQVKSIKQISDHITNLKRVGTGLGEYMFDKETLS